MKNYLELIGLKTFKERYLYLCMDSDIGYETFGDLRHVNQSFYTSNVWARIRRQVIVRDMGLDLGVVGHELLKVVVHHIIPITIYDLQHRSDRLTNLNNLISTSPDTHRAIHFGNTSLPKFLPTVRTNGDTSLW